MMEPNGRLERILHRLLVCACLLVLSTSVLARPRAVAPTPQVSPSLASTKKSARQEDSLFLAPPKDLLLHPEGEHKADALAQFVEGLSLEESGEMDKALAAYRKVLDVDPGQADLASRVAALLTRQDDFPQAIDIVKDAIKANPNASGPLLQLAFIYAKYLHRTDQAIDYVNRAIALDPRNIEAYERLFEIALAAGDEKKAIQSLDRAAEIKNDDPLFWVRLGKLYASITFKLNRPSNHDEIARTNHISK